MLRQQGMLPIACMLRLSIADWWKWPLWWCTNAAHLNIMNEQQGFPSSFSQTVLYLMLSRNGEAVRVHTCRHSCAREAARQSFGKPIKQPVQSACKVADASPLWSAHPNMQAS